MTDYGPGPCETCGEDVEGHTQKELKKCIAQRPARQRKTSPRNGRTIVQALLEEGWKELDTIVEHIMSEGEPKSWRDPKAKWNGVGKIDEWLQYGEWRGQAQGIAYMLAVLTNPYQPDVDAIRAEAMRRWEAGEDDGT